MITKGQIEGLVKEKIEGSDKFIVDISVSSGNQIMVEMDSFTGMKVQDFMEISRHIEGNLDRDVEDFALQVSSPGLDNPYKVKEQYHKNLGRSIHVKMSTGGKLEGELLKIEEEEIVLKTREKRRVEGKKSKKWVEEEVRVLLTDIKETKTVISFK